MLLTSAHVLQPKNTAKTGDDGRRQTSLVSKLYWVLKGNLIQGPLLIFTDIGPKYKYKSKYSIVVFIEKSEALRW